MYQSIIDLQLHPPTPASPGNGGGPKNERYVNDRVGGCGVAQITMAAVPRRPGGVNFDDP